MKTVFESPDKGQTIIERPFRQGIQQVKSKWYYVFRGREMQHPELGRRILDRVAEEVAEVGRVEVMPKQDGRNMTMVLGPDRKAAPKAPRPAPVSDAGSEPTTADESERQEPVAAEATE